MELHYIFVAFALLGGVFSQSVVEQSDDGSSGSIKFSTPNLNDEEAHSPWMPDQLRCDACRVVALQLYQRFKEFNDRYPKYKYKIPESELLDLTESTCTSTYFDSYGFKDVKGVHRLSGPGLDTADTPGIMQGGGRWPSRLIDMCEQYMGNIGEEVIYKGYARNPKSRKQFEDFLCNGEAQKSVCKDQIKSDTKDEL